MLCLLSSAFYFICDKIADDRFKDEIKPLLKANSRIKFVQYVEMNRVREKGIPLCKLSYKVLKGKYGYDPLLDIFPFPT